MYIAPNSKIKIYHNVPLDDTYVHTLYFNNLNEQNSYFHGNSNILKYSLELQSYQRVNKGSMRVEIPAENLYDCNYLAFQNTSFGSKWFYAFIKSVEYVNNITSEITFDIDPMMTYFFDVELKQSFVEREHTATDNFGDNLVDENLEVGDYKLDYESKAFSDNDRCVVLALTYHKNQTTGLYANQIFGCDMINGVPTGISYEKFNWNMNLVSDIGAIKDQLVSSQLDLSGVIGMFGFYSSMFGTKQSTGTTITEPAHTTYFVPRRITSIDGYTPKNKKVLQYPYNFLLVSDLQGTNYKYKYEFFNTLDNTCGFEFYGDTCLQPRINGYPKNYKNQSLNKNEVMTLSGFPTYATADSYYQHAMLLSGYETPYQRQQINNEQLIGVGGGALMTGLGVVTGNPLIAGMGIMSMTQSGMSTSNKILEMEKQKTAMNTQPNPVKSSSSGGGMFARGDLNLHFYQCHITHQQAKIIDDYFNCYGYACKELKVPNRNVRPHWTYTKTIGCNLIGNAPADDVAKLISIYDNGITFWKNPSEVGNYSLDNRV